MLAGMLSDIHTVTLNEKTGKSAIAADWIRALNDNRILTEKSGFLFKASLCGDHLLLAVAPCLINGERSFHYNMHLGKEDAFTLIGDINAQGIFTILFKPESREAASQHAADYLERFRKFAAFLTDTGYTGEGRLDEVTQQVLESLGLSPPPETLAGLL